MAYKLAIAATLTLALLSTTISAHPHSNTNLSPRKASGINCDGSSYCSNYSNKLAEILTKVNLITKGTTFSAGDQLACAGNPMFDNPNGDGTKISADGQSESGLCAMIGQNTPTYIVGDSENGQSNSAGDVVGDLIYHGCGACGSAPTVRVGNDLGKGCIVVNYVSDVCFYSDGNPCGR